MIMNPYVKIAIAAMAAVYLTPPIVARFVIPPAPEAGSEAVMRKNEITTAGITGFVTAAVWVVLGMATGAAK